MNRDQPFESVGPSGDVTPTRPKRVTVNGRELVLFRVQGRCMAIENSCPHQHMSAFHQAHIEGFVIRCPMHGWTFDLRTGAAVAGSGRIRTVEVHEENGLISVRRPPDVDQTTFPSWES